MVYGVVPISGPCTAISRVGGADGAPHGKGQRVPWPCLEGLIQDADLGIVGIESRDMKFERQLNEVDEKFDRPPLHIPEETVAAWSEVLERIRLRDRSLLAPAVQTLHRLPNSDETVEFSLENDESNGTQKFFGMVGTVLEALDRGSLLVVDELDCSMHPHLTYKLVEMFQSAEANPKGRNWCSPRTIRI